MGTQTKTLLKQKNNNLSVTIFIYFYFTIYFILCINKMYGNGRKQTLITEYVKVTYKTNVRFLAVTF